MFGKHSVLLPKKKTEYQQQTDIAIATLKKTAELRIVEIKISMNKQCLVEKKT